MKENQATLKVRGEFHGFTKDKDQPSANQLLLGRSSRRRCSVKKVVLNNFVSFTEKHLCQSLFLRDTGAGVFL